MQNIQLKIFVIQSGRPAYKIERSAGFWPGKLSKIIGGALSPSEEDKTALASTLGRKTVELFPPESEESLQ